MGEIHCDLALLPIKNPGLFSYLQSNEIIGRWGNGVIHRRWGEN